jgi:preprotein translocase subunit YajC
VAPADLLVFALPVLLLVFLFTSHLLAPGQQVVTTSGLHARLVSVDDTVVVLETAPGQSVRWDRRAIARVLADVPDDQTPHHSTDDDEK